VKKTRQNENVSFDLVIFDCDGMTAEVGADLPASRSF
jgi:hypothetical protein